MISVASIKIWKKKVGAVAYDDSTGESVFEFEPDFVSTGWELAPIKIPLPQSGNTKFSFPELKFSNTFKSLPGLLADVLPDKYGHALINTWLVKNGRRQRLGWSRPRIVRALWAGKLSSSTKVRSQLHQRSRKGQLFILHYQRQIRISKRRMCYGKENSYC